MKPNFDPVFSFSINYKGMDKKVRFIEKGEYATKKITKGYLISQ